MVLKHRFSGKYAGFKNVKFPKGNNQTDSSPLNFPVAACLKAENDKNLFSKICNRYGELRCFVFSVVSSSGDVTPIHV